MVRQLDPHLVRWATKIAFGGHPEKRLEELLAKHINNSFFPNANQKVQASRWLRSEIIGEVFQEKNLCDMCCRIEHYTDLKTSNRQLEEAAEQRSLFTRKNKAVVHGGGGSCRELGAVDCFSTVKLLSYLLNIQRGSNNINFSRMRHVLLFTRANAALYLLHTLKIVNRDQIVIIFGRSEPSTRDILDDLLKIRRCMLSGKVLILVGARHIYESLYDALNQHYTVEGEGENKKYFTRLTMNGYTASFPMHETFRCIAIEQEATCQTLLPPFINRFAKAFLNYSSAVAIQQRNLARMIRANSIVQTDDGKEADILKLLIPGYMDDTVDSLVLLFSSAYLNTAAEMQSALDYALGQLGYLCAPRRLQQLSNGIYQGFSNDRAQEVIRKWNQARTHSVVDDVAELSEYRTESIENFQHYFFLTEQRCLEFELIQQSISQLLPEAATCSVSEALDINITIGEGEILESFAKLTQGEGESFLVAIFDTSFQNCADQVEKFLFLVSMAALPTSKHVVVIGVVKNSSVAGIPTDNLFLHLDSKWAYLFVDEISPIQSKHVPLFEFLDYNTLTASQQIANFLNPEVFCDLVCSRALSIAQRVKKSANDIEKLKWDIVSTFRNYEGASIFIATRICEQLYAMETLNHGRWISLALRKLRQTDSLRHQLHTFLAAVVERCVLKYCTPLFGFANFQHSMSASPLHHIFSALILSKVIVHQLDLSSCVHIERPLTVEWFQITKSDSMFENDTDEVRFPFSFFLYHAMKPYASAGREVLQGKIREIFTYVNPLAEEGDSSETYVTLTAEEADAYASDVFFQRGLRTDEQQAALRMILNCRSSVKDAFTTIDGIHELLDSELNLLDAVIRVVTNPLIRLGELASSKLTAENITEVLIRAASDTVGIVSLGAIPDIILLTGDNFSVRLHHAVALGTLHLPLQEKRVAATLASQCATDYQRLVLEFLPPRLNPTAISMSKYLLPILFQSVSAMELPDMLINLLSSAFQNSQLYSLPALSFLMTRAVHLWLDSPEEKIESLTAVLDNTFSAVGVDAPISVLFSRCVFDYCTNSEVTAAVVSKASLIVDDGLRNVIMNGAVTSAADLICDKLRHNGPNSISDDEAALLSAIIEEAVIGSDHFTGGVTLFTLRSLSSGGMELDVAKAALTVIPNFLPDSITSHQYVKDLCAPKNTQQSAFGLFDDFYRARSLISSIFGQPRAEPQHLVQFSQYIELGRILALLDCGFCSVEDRSLSDMNILRQFAPDIQSDLYRRIVSELLRADINPVLKLMPKELKRTWILSIIISITSPNPTFQFLNQMITSPENPIVPFPDIPAPAGDKAAGHVCRFLHSAAALASATLNPQAHFNLEDLNRHKKTIFEDILTTKCPVCSRPMDFWPGCFAVVCECKGCFCGWCLTATGGDAHPHVLRCPENLIPNTYFGTEVQYYQVRNKHKLAALRRYFDTQCAPALRVALLGAILPNLNILNIPTDTLGAAADRYSLDLSQQRLLSAGNAVKFILFDGSLSDDPALLWIQGLLLLHLRNIPTPCQSMVEMQERVKVAVQDSRSPNELMEAFRASMNATAQSSSEIESIIFWDDTFELSIQQLPEYERSLAMPHHFAYRRRFTEAMLWNRVANDGQLTLLDFLNTHKESLEAESTSSMFSILRYMGDVIRICYGKQMTRAMANDTSFDNLADEFDVLGGERMNDFFAKVQYIYNKVERFECKGYDDLDKAFGPLEFNGSMKLKWLLPSTSDEVTLLPVLFKGVAPDGPNNPPITWRSLGMIQNDTVRILQGSFNSPDRTVNHRTFQLSLNEVVSFDMRKDLLDNLPFYIDPQPVATLTDDITTLQLQIAHSAGLWGKPTIAQEIPEFQYSEDIRKSAFSKMLEKDPEIPKPEVQDALNKAVTQNPEFGPACLDFLFIVAVELTRRPPVAVPHSLQELVDTIAIPLTEEQQRGRDFLSSPYLGRELLPEHIVSVCALLWDGGVISGAMAELSQQDAATLTQELHDICQSPHKKSIVPYLRIGLRLIGVQLLSTEQTPAFLNVPFDIYLQEFMGRYYEDYLADTVLGRLPVTQFDAVFQIADTILKDSIGLHGASGGGDAETGNSYEVPIAMLRPIIRIPEPVAAPAPPAAAQPIIPRFTSVNIAASQAAPNPPGDELKDDGAAGVAAPPRSRWEGRGDIRQARRL